MVWVLGLKCLSDFFERRSKFLFEFLVSGRRAYTSVRK